MTEKQLRQAVADYLKQYIGVKMGSAGHLAILAMFNSSGLCKRYKMTEKDAWCATAVSAAFISICMGGTKGSNTLFPCVECSCYYMIEYAKAAGIWKESDSYVPKTGDVILYDWQDSGVGDNTGNPDHVGIVDTCDGKTIKVIEGNISKTVGYRTIAVNGKYIRGFITPQYSKFATAAEQEPAKTPTKEVKSTSYATGFDKNLAGTYKTTADLHCRNGAGTNHKSLVVIPKGTSVRCYGYYSKDSSGAKWLYIQFKIGDTTYTGFSHSKYLKK